VNRSFEMKEISLLSSHNLASASQAVWTNGTRTLALAHVIPDDSRSPRAVDERSVEVVTKDHVDEVIFPADWALSRMLRAHLSS
jgi:hypothetical protein